MYSRDLLLSGQWSIPSWFYPALTSESLQAEAEISRMTCMCSCAVWGQWLEDASLKVREAPAGVSTLHFKKKTAQSRYIYNKLYICKVCNLSFAITVVTFTTIKIMNTPFKIELEESCFILFHNYLIFYARHCAGWEGNTDLPCRTSLPGKWVPGPSWHERGDTSAWEGCVEKGRIWKSEEMVF